MSPKQPEHPKPADAELEILNILWDLEAATVREIHERLTATRAIQYTTTLKTMQVMTTKGLLKRDESERSHVYRPAVRRERVQRQLAGHLLRSAFGGSARSLLHGALDAKAVSEEELQDLQQLLDEYSKRRKR